MLESLDAIYFSLFIRRFCFHSGVAEVLSNSNSIEFVASNGDEILSISSGVAPNEDLSDVWLTSPPCKLILDY